MKALLFLFYICHVILIVQKGNTFDLQYLRLFRLLQNIKQIITASSLLHQTEAKYVSFIPGRQPPIVGFIFRISRFRGQPPSSFSSFSSEAAASPYSSKDASLQTTAQFKKQLRQSLDVQIRLILRKSCGRALQLSGSKGPARETQGTSLFILDAKRAVFVDDELPTGGDEIEDKGTTTSTISSTTNNEESILPPSISTSTSQPASRRPYSFHFNDSGENGTEEMAISSGSGTSSLRRYILALARGVTHQAGSHGRPELPNSKNWFDSSIGLFKIFFLRKSQRGRSDIVEKLKSFLDPEYKFSTSRCVQAIPVAKEAYLRDIPSKYNSSVHELHLQKALKEFNQMARGPAVEYYLTRLKEDLLKVWRGRQLCDSESLTGRPCIFEVHRVPREEGPGTDETEFERGANNTNSSLPVFNHSSGVRSLLACNCGRSRKIQEDPFDLDVANFYSFNVEGCCNLLPSFELQETASSSCFVGGKEHFSHFHHTHTHTLTHSHSKTQSLPTSIPSNRVNRKSSWALHRLGPSSTYSTETGLSQEGFLPGCNFLSSVELPSYIQSQERPGPPPSIAGMIQSFLNYISSFLAIFLLASPSEILFFLLNRSEPQCVASKCTETFVSTSSRNFL
jgi:protein SMG8